MLRVRFFIYCILQWVQFETIEDWLCVRSTHCRSLSAHPYCWWQASNCRSNTKAIRAAAVVVDADEQNLLNNIIGSRPRIECSRLFWFCLPHNSLVGDEHYSSGYRTWTGDTIITINIDEWPQIIISLISTFVAQTVFASVASLNLIQPPKHCWRETGR